MRQSPRDDRRPVLAFCSTMQSGPGRRMEGVLAQLARKERARVRIAHIDVDLRPRTAERLGVSTVPTLVLIQNGRVIDRIEGRASAPQIERFLEDHLGSAGEPMRLSA